MLNLHTKENKKTEMGSENTLLRDENNEFWMILIH